MAVCPCGWPRRLAWPQALLSCPSILECGKSLTGFGFRGKGFCTSVQLTTDLIMKWYFPCIGIFHVNVSLGKLVGRSGKFFVKGRRDLGNSEFPTTTLTIKTLL